MDNAPFFTIERGLDRIAQRFSQWAVGEVGDVLSYRGSMDPEQSSGDDIDRPDVIVAIDSNHADR